jgi:hypothetical protein
LQSYDLWSFGHREVIDRKREGKVVVLANPTVCMLLGKKGNDVCLVSRLRLDGNYHRLLHEAILRSILSLDAAVECDLGCHPQRLQIRHVGRDRIEVTGLYQIIRVRRA